MTLDYDDDFKFFKKIIEHFGDQEFSLKEIVEYIDLNPDIKKINYHCHQEWKTNQKMKTKLLLKS
jgi:spore coat polysaccharide biosynthesis protein SpsF (cytidylyltransferase family)